MTKNHDRLTVSDLLMAKRIEAEDFKLFEVHINDMNLEELKGVIGYMLVHPELSILHNQKKEPWAYQGLVVNKAGEEFVVLPEMAQAIEDTLKKWGWRLLALFIFTAALLTAGRISFGVLFQ